MIVNDLVALRPLLRAHAYGWRTAVGARQLPGPGGSRFLLGHPEEAREVLHGLAEPLPRVGDAPRLALEHGGACSAVVEEIPDPPLEGRPVGTRGLPLDPLGVLVQQHQAKNRRKRDRHATRGCRIMSSEAYGMDRKLTIRVDERVIVRAKAWAKRRGVSLSDAVESVLERLPEEESGRPLTDWTRSLLGVGAGPKGRAATDAAVRKGHLDHVAERHR